MVSKRCLVIDLESQVILGAHTWVIYETLSPLASVTVMQQHSCNNVPKMLQMRVPGMGACSCSFWMVLLRKLLKA